jgi:hypothetical protein
MTIFVNQAVVASTAEIIVKMSQQQDVQGKRNQTIGKAVPSIPDYMLDKATLETRTSIYDLMIASRGSKMCSIKATGSVQSPSTLPSKSLGHI